MKKFLVLIVILIIAGFVTYKFLPNYLTETKNDESISFEVKKGASLSSVAQDLYDEGVIRSKLWFRYKGQDMAKNIKPGTYDLEPELDIYKIYEIIQKGEQEEQIKLTFPEGFILHQFAEKIEEAQLGTAEEFIQATEDYFELKGYDIDTSNLYFKMEGYLFPDTYYFTKKQSIDEIVKKLATTMDSVFTDEYNAKAKDMGLSRHQLLTIASLIEREAYNDAERATIAGVIYNRLDKGMLLQIDATVIYGLGEGKEHMTRVLYADLEKDNPFNTYRNTSLPPGPIASPGKKSIEAALYPEDHDYLYYVLGEGGHVFAKTFNEHKINVNKYR